MKKPTPKDLVVWFGYFEILAITLFLLWYWAKNLIAQFSGD